ncbi:hypothetical protein K2P56_02550 [Patescibacteria group bacterium]|nr:hypothetical protein [Patescibacteria group bacterium]
MSIENRGEITCANCSACCKAGIEGVFTPKEAAFLRRGGTDLAPLRDLDVMHAIALYEFRSDCGHIGKDPLTGNSICTQHENPDRPHACKTFVPGSLSCRLQREMQGVAPSGFDKDAFLRGEE